MNTRFMVTSLLPLLALPLLTACVIATGAAPAAQNGTVEAIEPDSTDPAQMAAGLADGKPPRLRPSAAMSYWVWQSPRGDWHLRSTTSHQLHRFQGRVHPLEGATLGNIKATRLEWGDRIRLQGEDIVFDFSTQGGEDGFDFKLNGDACVEMDLRIDKTSHPRLVVIGKTEQAPAAAHFVVCP
jgi:hypothetical protein